MEVSVDVAPNDSILRLPDELISSILYSLTSRDTVRFGRSCKRIWGLSEEYMLWRHYCKTEYDYWKHRDYFSPAIVRGEPTAQWKDHFKQRVQRDAHNHLTFESLLETQHERYAKIQDIAESEFEARGLLQRHSQALSHQEHVLSRRYWAEVTLRLTRRTMALRIWHKFQSESELDLEEQIAAFDLFVMRDPSITVETIKVSLDRLAHNARAENPGLDDLDVEQKAIIIIRHLRDQRVVGLEQGREYRHMRNNFISSPLIRKEHGALPLQSAIIFCSVAKRLGIDARPCNYPAHIFVAVRLTPATGPNPSPCTESLQSLADKYIYFDPFTQETPVSLEDLSYRLRIFGYPLSVHPVYLSPASVLVLVRRTGENIHQSFNTMIGREESPNAQIENPLAFYAFLWCCLLVRERPLGDPQGEPRGELLPTRPLLASLPHYLREQHPEDLDLFAKYLGPIYATQPENALFQATLREVKAADANRKPLVRREGSLMEKVKFKIGTLFRHKRYGYVAVIRAWDFDCKADERWIEQMRVDNLKRGREQSFYHVLVDDRSERYVAEDNIEPIHEDPPEALLHIAGKFFKRWDDEKKVFVSNVQDEFPDD